MKTKILLTFAILILLIYCIWYSFMFIAPLLAFAIVAGVIIILVYLPLTKIFKNNEKSN